MPTTDSTYLCGGVYAEFDGYYVWLWTERDGRAHRIALDPDVYDRLEEYANRVWQREG